MVKGFFLLQPTVRAGPSSNAPILLPLYTPSHTPRLDWLGLKKITQRVFCDSSEDPLPPRTFPTCLYIEIPYLPSTHFQIPTSMPCTFNGTE